MGQAKNRKAEIEAMKARPIIVDASFFYSPTDELKNVLSIRFGHGPNCLPLKLAEMIMDPAYVAKQDEEQAKDPTFAQDLFVQLDQMLAAVNEAINTDSRREMTVEQQRHLVICAGNIYWLTLRGFIQQTEYNGTLFGTFTK